MTRWPFSGATSQRGRVRRLYGALIVMLVVSNAAAIAWGRAHGARERRAGYTAGYLAGREDEGRAFLVRTPYVDRRPDGRVDTLYTGICREPRPRTERLP